ncbi:MAG TPA: hypothetical protein VGK74_10745 [Symbiobacteriaceae bacterium]
MTPRFSRSQPPMVAVDDQGVARVPTRVLDAVSEPVKRPVTHVRFYPAADGGSLYIVPATPLEHGAEPVQYAVGPEAFARVNLTGALRRYHLEHPAGGVRVFEVVEREVKPGVRYVALNVRSSRVVPISFSWPAL